MGKLAQFAFMQLGSLCEDVDATTFLIEFDVSVDQGKDCVIGTESNALAGTELRSHLTNDNAACFCRLSAVQLHSTPLTIGIASVTTGALTFFMCHEKTFSLTYLWITRIDPPCRDHRPVEFNQKRVLNSNGNPIRSQAPPRFRSEIVVRSFRIRPLVEKS